MEIIVKAAVFLLWGSILVGAVQVHADKTSQENTKPITISSTVEQ